MNDTLKECLGCDAQPGQAHTREDCTHAQCPDCGEQLYMHECDYWPEGAEGPGRPALWHGADQQAAVARAQNWWTTASGVDHPVEDYTRVRFAIALGQIAWDAYTQKYTVENIDEAALDSAIARSR
ncbi:hypothetical protein L3Q65_00875 (plasmid) [Amycolatopsis sp. FU40]|uniref:hypothetical protein n=1 Tax=Amycolatopsis sp. FU40 TaxID=2914159 RepID=UPI001F1D10BE|nr:hypothetical protein [Amycolatopsis sp. FU40]UKD50878.1 hypothetical protein L3Q65_00875 [Amycolatopsis sp. FU40]